MQLFFAIVIPIHPIEKNRNRNRVINCRCEWTCRASGIIFHQSEAESLMIVTFEVGPPQDVHYSLMLS